MTTKTASVLASDTNALRQLTVVDAVQLVVAQSMLVTAAEDVKSILAKFNPETVTDAPPLDGAFPRIPDVTGAALRDRLCG